MNDAPLISATVRPASSFQPGYFLDIKTIRQREEDGLARTPPGTLMAAAGAAVAEVALRLWKTLPADAPVLLLVGPGNNGGDALVAGRHLRRAGLQVQAAIVDTLMQTPPRATDACAAWQAWRADGHDFIPLSKVPARLQPDMLLIDGLFGIGLSRAVDAPLAALIQAVDAAGATVLAIDVPSGLDADTGAAVGGGALMRADQTVTLIGDKPGLHTGDGLRHAGTVWLAPLLTPPSPPPTPAGGVRLDSAWAHAHQPHRPLDAHKGTAGDVLIVGGRLGMAGAARLAARGATAAGAGRVWIGTEAPGQPPRPSLAARSRQARARRRHAPASLALSSPARATMHPPAPGLTAPAGPSAHRRYPGARPLPDAPGTRAATRAASAALLPQPGQPQLSSAPIDPQHPETMQFVWQDGIGWPGHVPVLVVGCGLGQDSTARRWLRQALTSQAALVLDADALNLLAAGAVRPGRIAAPCILSPHPLEAARLLATDMAQVQADRIGAARRLARRFGAVVVLKGAGSVIARPDGHYALNTSGHPVLGTAGTGDVLAGTMAALLASLLRQQVPAADAAWRAACLGTWLHGRAGQWLAQTRGPAGIPASQVAGGYPAILAALARHAQALERRRPYPEGRGGAVQRPPEAG